MKFDRDASEDTVYPVLPAGEYDFDVEKVEYVKSKSGTMNWKITLDIESADGKHAKCFEYFPEKAEMGWKFAQFYKAIGWTSDDTDDMKDAAGEVGRCYIVIEQGTNGYQDRNKVKRYIARKEPQALEISSDDLPF